MQVAFTVNEAVKYADSSILSVGEILAIAGREHPNFELVDERGDAFKDRGQPVLISGRRLTTRQRCCG
jgi:hypothetical protein